MSRPRLVTVFRIAAAVCALQGLPCAARLQAGQVLPDRMTIRVGEVAGVGSDVTVVLTKHSVRAANYLCGVATPEGFKHVTFPVSTYRGHVQGDPLVYVNGNVEPGGILNLNFTENREIVARIRDLKIDVPEGKCNPTMGTGHQVVPLSAVRQRQVPTPGGYLIPEVPMRQSTWTIRLPASYTSQFELEKVVSQVEQRFNDGDFIFARDMGTAWEIETVIIDDPASTKGVDWATVPVVDAGARKASLTAYATGTPGTNRGKINSLAITGIHHEARILLHEAAHLYDNPHHQIGAGDGLCGGGAFWDINDVAIMIENRKARYDEANLPAVVYGSPLPPRATYDFASTRKNTPVTIDVLENDYDGNGEAITLRAVQEQSARGGSVAISGSGQAVYTPPADFVGMDRFTYTIVDSAGLGNRSGVVKVDVRDEGLAVHFGFEEAERENIEQRRKTRPDDPIFWLYGLVDKRPESEQWMYHFRNLGPYASGARGTAHWLAYAPAPGVRGQGLFNPPGGDSKAQVQLGDVGDPGYGSLSASLWVLFPPGGKGGPILCKGCSPFRYGVINGWSIYRNGSGFSFSGNTVRLLQGEAFRVESGDTIEPNTWYHLVMVMDRQARKLRAYVNNREVTSPGTNSTIPDGLIEYHGPLHLFNSYGGKAWGASQALVDELKIFTCALNQGQVAELYAEGANAKVPEFGTAAAPAAQPR